MLLGDASMNIIGDLKSLLLLWENLARNRRYTAYVEEVDILTFYARAEHEGITFLTQTLPRIGKALDSYHSTNKWQAPEGFDMLLDGSPVFLGKAVRRAREGEPLAVDCVRQLTLVFYKLEVDYDEAVEKTFIEAFKSTDKALPSCREIATERLGRTLLDRMRYYITRILCNTDPRDIRPCHGSGATACKTRNSDKWRKMDYYSQLDDVYPYSDHFFYSATHLSDEMGQLEKSETKSTPRARVCLVPKDSRGPRIISCEPSELMFIQQGLMMKLYECLETQPLTAGFVNFTDQTINRNLAREGSLNGKWATIDLSEASDRVTLDLVSNVFPRDWVECLLACRSAETLLPDGEVVTLNKFAPMGSSCCFPVEALVFWACAQASIEEAWKHPDRDLLSRLSAEGFTSNKRHGDQLFPVLKPRDPSHRFETFVYGDDIIIPSTFAEVVVNGLQAIGLVVNNEKSYLRGPFRESCGGDYYLGVDVTPVRVRKYLGKSVTSAVTNADLANCFIAKFGEYFSLELIQVIEEAQEYIFPRSEFQLPAAIRSSSRACNDVHFLRKWNSKLQRFEHRVLTLTSSSSEEHEPDWFELLRKELQSKGPHGSRLEDPYVHPLRVMDAKLDPGYYTDPHSVRMKWAWVWLG